MIPALPGPRIAPRSGRTRQAVILLHGFGADGTDLIEIGRAWQDWLPDTAFYAPHAPEPCIMGGGGQQWFPLTFRDPQERWRGVQHAAPVIEGLIEGETARTGLPAGRIALVGFSQGTMMALHVGLRRADSVAAIVGFSGTLVLDGAADPDALAAAIRSRPPVLLTHGDGDDIIPVDALFLSAEALAGAEVPTQWHLSAGIGHGIDEGALRHAGLFLAAAFGLPFPG